MAQLNMLEAEKKKMLTTMTMQYEQQYTQQKLMIEQTYKQQHSQLEMAKTQRDMAIQQQAAQMMARPSSTRCRWRCSRAWPRPTAARTVPVLLGPPRPRRPRARPRRRARARPRARSRRDQWRKYSDALTLG